ncbi:hypothetical protein [Cellulomonas sp. URHD0024]|uniref:hypothetical protein n=1 Tax=Cellulomonas sp. URHD0024 TaxID=1302620 RepID=UPI0004081C06|nr:hypothetical protein [Cellulomonas sp. URHD0024]
MSTIDLPMVRSITLADLRRVNAPVVLGSLVVVLVAWASGLLGHATDAAEQRAEQVQHQRQAAHRVHALAADWSIEQSFLDASRRDAIIDTLGTVTAERAAVAAERGAALTNASAVLDGSAGKADDAKRAQLAAAIAVLSGPETVYSRVAVATADASRLAGEVSAAEAAWTVEQQRLATVSAAAAAHDAARSSVRSAARATPVSHVRTTPNLPRGGTVQEVGEATLRSLPGNAGVTIHWNDPDIGGHLGAVWSGNTTYIMVNGAALAGNPGKTRDVVRHEIAHIYQGRLAAANGLSWSELGRRMSAAFGANPQEKAADCVARRFGASWTYYTSDCGGAQKQAWVDGMIGGRLP